MLIPVKMNIIPPQIIRHNQEDIGRLLRFRNKRGAQQAQQGQFQFHHLNFSLVFLNLQHRFS